MENRLCDQKASGPQNQMEKRDPSIQDFGDLENLCLNMAETVLIALLRRPVSEEHLLYPGRHLLGGGRDRWQVRLGQRSLLCLHYLSHLFGPCSDLGRQVQDGRGPGQL